MNFSELYQQFISDILHASIAEYVAVIFGIISVWYSKKEHVLVYPTGLINTIIYIYLSFKSSLFGEASVNFYYTVMSIYGWWQWTRKDAQQQLVLHISYSSKREWKQQLLFFGVGYAVIYLILVYLKKYFAGDAIPWADAFASAAAYTGMWLMTRKKIESWYWWIATNIASIPLYFSKHYVMTSVYYLILLVMAIQGLIAWKHNCKSSTAVAKK
ncbi:MAG: hypothetical protein RLY16_596 [Bacteroidota bacterium]